jgi:hypothetical protein
LGLKIKPQRVARAEVQPTCVGLAKGSVGSTLRAAFSVEAPSTEPVSPLTVLQADNAASAITKMAAIAAQDVELGGEVLMGARSYRCGAGS